MSEATAVTLVPMNEAELAHLRRSSSEDVREVVAAGIWPPDDARRRALDEFDRTVTGGLSTPDQFFRIIVDDRTGERVGQLWFHLDRRPAVPMLSLYVFDVFSAFRHQGYGRAALVALIREARSLGVRRIGGMVWESNRVARTLYDAFGARTISRLVHWDDPGPFDGPPGSSAPDTAESPSGGAVPPRGPSSDDLRIHESRSR